MTGAATPTVRPERPEDFASIAAVVTEAFPTSVESQLVEALRNSGRLSVSLVAVVNDQVVGHIAFSPVTVEGVGGGAGLAPVAVRLGSRRKGIGALLVREGLAAARASGFGFAVVLGEPAYYSRFGFSPASRWGLSDEYGGGDAFQALELSPGAIPSGGGLVKFAPEFSAFGGTDSP